MEDGGRRHRLAPPLLYPEPAATIENAPLRRRLPVKRAFFLLLLLFPLAAAPLLAAGKSSKNEVRFGIAVAQKGMWREALFRFQRAVEIDPDNASAQNNLAVALEQMGEFDRAREHYEKALDLKPKDLYIHHNYDLFREADDKRNRRERRAKR
jgi:tetratricopeptide (TPR) repeat protein